VGDDFIEAAGVQGVILVGRIAVAGMVGLHRQGVLAATAAS
jgi:hypothetical protein